MSASRDETIIIWEDKRKLEEYRAQQLSAVAEQGVLLARHAILPQHAGPVTKPLPIGVDALAAGGGAAGVDQSVEADQSLEVEGGKGSGE